MSSEGKRRVQQHVQTRGLPIALASQQRLISKDILGAGNNCIDRQCQRLDPLHPTLVKLPSAGRIWSRGHTLLLPSAEVRRKQDRIFCLGFIFSPALTEQCRTALMKCLLCTRHPYFLLLLLLICCHASGTCSLIVNM